MVSLVFAAFLKILPDNPVIATQSSRNPHKQMVGPGFFGPQKLGPFIW